MDTKNLRFGNGDRVIWNDRTCEVNNLVASGRVISGQFHLGLEWYTIALDEHCRLAGAHGNSECASGWVNRTVELDAVRAE